MRILHIADLHIRCSPTSDDRFDEYQTVFRRLVDMVRGQSVDACLIAGDVFHSKYKCSARGAELFVWLVRTLSEISPVYVLAGNHDFQQEDPTSPDLVTAVLGGSRTNVHASACQERVHVMNETSTYKCGRLSFSVVTVQDALETGASRGHLSALPPFPRDPSAEFNVAVFHGPVSYSRLPNGSDLRDGVPSSWFSRFDAVLLGDIHAPQVHRASLVSRNRKTSRWTWDDGAGPWGYCGSTIQQNFGEPIFGHGFMVWDLAEREVTHFHVDNDHGFADAYFEDGRWTVKLGENDFVDKASPLLPMSLQFRVKSETGRFERARLCEYPAIRQVQNPVPDQDIAAYLASSEHFDDEWVIAEDISKASFFESGVPSRIRTRIETFRKSAANARDQQARALESFSVRRLVIHNVLCYADLEVDFEALRGRVVGLAGPNSSGKSSFIESICIAIFGAGYRAPDGIVRRGTSKATTEVVVNDCVIRRTFAVVKGRVSAKSAEFERDGVVVRKGKVAVDAIVRSTFGTLDMFLASSCVTQGNDNDFLAMSCERRVAYLDGVLGLSSIEATEACLKEAYLIQKNIAEYLDARVEGMAFEDPAPREVSLRELRAMDLSAEERRAAEECASLQCKPASRVDVAAAEAEIETIRVSSTPLVEVSGRYVATDCEYEDVLREYEGLGAPPPLPTSVPDHLVEGGKDLIGDAVELRAKRESAKNMIGELEADIRSLLRAKTEALEARPTPPSITKEERAILDGPAPALPRTHEPHNPECWACNARGDGPDPFASWFHENFAQREVFDTHEAWSARKDEISKQLAELETETESQKRALRELDKRIAVSENADYVLWAARERTLRDELFTTAAREKLARARLASLREGLAHTRYSDALSRLERVRRRAASIELEIKRDAAEIERITQRNDAFHEASRALDLELSKAESLKRLYEHFKGYKAHLYRTAIGPRICETANEILDGLAPVRVSESDMVFSVNGMSPSRAGGFYRSVASIAIRIAISKTCTQMFVDEGFVACDTANVRNVVPFLRRLLTVFEGVLVCSHIDAIMDETDVRWTFSRGPR